MSEKGPDRAGREAFMEKAQLDAIVNNLAGEVLKSKGFGNQSVDKFMETDEAIVLMDILEKMVKKWGPKLKVVNSSDRIYSLESFSGNRNAQVLNTGSVVFEVDKYQFLQKEIVELQGIHYEETEARLAESLKPEIEKSALKAGFQILGQNEGELLFPVHSGKMWEEIYRDMETYPEFQRIYIKSGDIFGKIEVWKNNNGEYHADYYYVYKDTRTPPSGVDGKTIEEVVRGSTENMRQGVKDAIKAEESERLEKLDSQLEEPGEEVFPEEGLPVDAQVEDVQVEDSNENVQTEDPNENVQAEDPDENV